MNLDSKIDTVQYLTHKHTLVSITFKLNAKWINLMNTHDHLKTAINKSLHRFTANSLHEM